MHWEEIWVNLDKDRLNILRGISFGPAFHHGPQLSVTSLVLSHSCLLRDVRHRALVLMSSLEVIVPNTADPGNAVDENRPAAFHISIHLSSHVPATQQTHQFIAAASGFGALGKNSKTHATAKNANAVRLIGKPHLPSEKRHGSNGSWYSRFLAMQPMAIRYDVSRPTEDSEVMTLKAIVEPMMIREATTVKSKVTVTAFSGISIPGRT